jgi:hypothetical protein
MQEFDMVPIRRVAAAGLAGALACLAAPSAQAGLFIAKDVWMTMVSGSPDSQMAEAMYGVTPRVSVGAGWVRMQSDERVGHVHSIDIRYVQGNYLIHRIHRPDSVANFYGFAGLGVARGDRFSGREPSLHGGLQADWETRRWYVNGNVHWWHSDAFRHRIDSLTVGWAPYAAEYEEWATWFLLRGERRENLSTGTEVTPMLRLFRKSWWFEVGRSNRGSWSFNVMHVF